MSRWLVFIYGLVAYLIFLGVFLYAIGFLGNVVVPKSIDSGEPGPLSTALVINGLLLGVFALQHSVMARPAFKDWLTGYIPRAAERSTYVMASNLALVLLFWQWRPIEGTVWNMTNPVGQTVLYTLFGLGWLIVFVATCLISHFDLFGLRQVWFYLRGQEYRPVPFSMPGPYRFVRHPLYVGWLLTFWAAPTMTIAHLVFAIGTTVYILVAIQLEERDLVAAHGESYAAYRRSVPMLLPRVTPKTTTQLPAKRASTG
jgi:protein-S-isoprenylcysteine O-methyltransferase Ste14